MIALVWIRCDLRLKDLAANNGGFIKRWCPELKKFSNKLIHDPAQADMMEQSAANCTIGVGYPFPIVDYKTKWTEALAMYKSVKNNNNKINK